MAGGNGIVSLEKYKKKIEKVLDISINIYGFDTGSGLPESVKDEDLPFFWKSNMLLFYTFFLRYKIYFFFVPLFAIFISFLLTNSTLNT